jgi:hypothetical protein
MILPAFECQRTSFCPDIPSGQKIGIIQLFNRTLSPTCCNILTLDMFNTSMKLITSLCLLLCPFLLCAQNTGLIAYSADGEFHWGMFRGKVKPGLVTEAGKNVAAVTVSSLSYQTFDITSRSAKVSIAAFFNPKESWTKYPRIPNPEEALIHERRHFDICEIYARKIRQEVSQNRFHHGNFNQKLDAIFKRFAGEFQSEQQKYDHETSHSLNKEVQLKWNAMIDAQLDALSAYEENVVTVVFN